MDLSEVVKNIAVEAAQGMARDAQLAEAYLAGRRVGLLNLSNALNPFADGTAEQREWHQGWFSAIPKPEIVKQLPEDDERLNEHARADARDQQRERA